jgi:hypothetical protein
MFKCNGKGWIAEELMIESLREVGDRRPGSLLKKRVMQVLRFSQGSLNQKKSKLLSCNVNTDLMIISGGMSSYLQVLDVKANQPFKDQLCHLYRAWLLSRNCPLTPAGDKRRPSEALLGKLVKTAWNDISPESIFNTV